MRLYPSSEGREGLTHRAHGIGGPVPKTGPYPSNQAARNRHNGALLASGRCDAVEHRLEDRVTGQCPPSRFDQHMAQATDALAAHVAPPNRCPRGVLTGCQASVAKQGPLIGTARHITQFGREGPCDDLADAWDTPIDGFERRLGFGLLPQQAAYLEQLARGKAPLVGQERETHVELGWQLPRGNLPSANSRASFLASRRSVLTVSLAATATEAGLTTMLVIPAVVRTRCNTKPENPASYAEKMLAPGNHRGKLSARRTGSAGTVAVFTICRCQRQVTVYVSLWTSMPTSIRSPV